MPDPIPQPCTLNRVRALEMAKERDPTDETQKPGHQEYLHAGLKSMKNSYTGP